MAAVKPYTPRSPSAYYPEQPFYRRFILDTRSRLGIMWRWQLGPIMNALANEINEQVLPNLTQGDLKEIGVGP